MRPLEIALAAVLAAVLTGIMIPQLRSSPVARHAALVAALLLVVHLLVEGPRWQMFPAYLLTACLFIAWLVRAFVRGPGHAAGWLAGLGAGAGMLLLAVSVVLSVTLPVFRFPRPKGPYSVGSVSYRWTDTSRPELFTPAEDDHRELVARVWYPARGSASEPRVPYMEDADTLTAGLARVFHFPFFFFGHFRRVVTNAVSGAPVADGEGIYPVVIFLSGLGGFSGSNTFQVEELASRGFVVVGLDQPGGAAAVRRADGRVVLEPPREEIQPLIEQSASPRQIAPDLNGHALPNGIIPYFAQDVSCALDRLGDLSRDDPKSLLGGHLGLRHVGVLGISLGAIVAAEAARVDPRITAVLMMDAEMPLDVVRHGLDQPSMWITRGAADMRLERSRSGGWPEEAIAETLTTMRAVFDAHAPGSAWYVEMPGMFHVNFTDAPFWSPFTTGLGLTGPVDGRKMWDAVNTCTVAFFDESLRAAPQPLLDGSRHSYPWGKLERR